jgi:hypothetical protein
LVVPPGVRDMRLFAVGVAVADVGVTEVGRTEDGADWPLEFEVEFEFELAVDMSIGVGTIDDGPTTLRDARWVLGSEGADVPSSANARALPVSKHDYDNWI